ncbi:MAG: TolC family protein [bacterium]
MFTTQSTLSRVRSTALAFLLGGITLAPALGAQDTWSSSTPAAGKPITFDEAITIALKQNTTLKQSANAAALSATQVTSRKNQFLPSLSVSTSSSQSLGRTFSQSEGTIVNQTTQNLNLGLSSSVTVFDGFQNVSALREAQANAAASVSELSRARQTTVFTVASDFLSLVTGQEQLGVQRANLAAQEAQEAQVQKLVTAKARPISDLYQQQATTAAARSSVLSAEREVELGKIALIQVLQLDARATYDFVAPTVKATTATAQAFQLDTLLDRAFANRADLAAQSSRVSAAQQAVTGASGARLPTVSVSAGYNTGYSSATDLSIGEQFNQRRGGSVSVGVSVPLFDRGSSSVATQQARIEADNAHLALDNQRQTVALEVRRAYLDFQSAQQQLTLAAAQQKAADLAVSATQQRYQVGTSTLLELTLARAQQTQAASAVVSAKFTLAFQQALMAYYTGDLEPGRVVLGE